MIRAFISTEDQSTYRIIIKQEDYVLADVSIERINVLRALTEWPDAERFVVDLRSHNPDGSRKI